jgi:rSAM/selenodomain-associated transferase 1
MLMKKSLIIFAREPLPGQVKTRLATSIGDKAAAEEYESMLQEVLKSSRRLSNVEIVVYWACDVPSLLRLAETYHCTSRRQCEGDLGQRMQTAFEEMFSGGSLICCIIGSDTPDLPLAYIREAYRQLETGLTDVIFGPSSDGGYYLLGLRKVWPHLFTNIPWSSAAVLALSLTAANNAGAKTALLPEWHDIDTIEDLQAYQERI